MSQDMSHFSCKVLWAAPFCLHDSSSGAAIQMKLVLEQLVKRGFSCHAVSALTFDAANGTSLFPNFEEQLKAEQEWFYVTDNGVSYEYFKTASRFVKDMTREEDGKFYGVFLRALERLRPDVLLIYGGGVMEMSIVAECRRRGIKTMMHVPNGNYANYSFPNVDMVLCDCPATAHNYYTHCRANMQAMGTFIDPAKVLVQGKKDAKYITLINPHSSKGISIFLRLVLMAKEKHPTWKFLVIESRGRWADAMELYKQNYNDFTNVDVAQHTTDIRLVYAKTKLILAPSLWYEGFGRVAAEAIMNGIPVISSTSGGLPDAVNGGGLSIAAPQKCHADFSYFPSEEEVQPWMEAMETILKPREYKKWQAKALEAAKQHDIEKSTDTLISLMRDMFDGKASIHPQFFLR